MIHNLTPNKSPEPTRVTPSFLREGFSGSIVVGRAWLSFLRSTCMKIALIVGVLLTAYFVDAADFGKQSDGQPGQFISTQTNISFQPVSNAEALWTWVLRNVEVTPHSSTTNTWILSGELRQFNIGTPMEGYPIFFGGPDQLPHLVGLTDSQGRFSFTLCSSTNKNLPIRALTFDPKGSSWIFVGGLIESDSQSPRFRMKANSLTWRYSVGSVLKVVEPDAVGNSRRAGQLNGL